jgi:hypothetical protein
MKFITFQIKRSKFTFDYIEINNFQFVLLKLNKWNLELFNVKVLNLHNKILIFTTFNL